MRRCRYKARTVKKVDATLIFYSGVPLVITNNDFMKEERGIGKNVENNIYIQLSFNQHIILYVFTYVIVIGYNYKNKFVAAAVNDSKDVLLSS